MISDIGTFSTALFDTTMINSVLLILTVEIRSANGNKNQTKIFIALENSH